MRNVPPQPEEIVNNLLLVFYIIGTNIFEVLKVEHKNEDLDGIHRLKQ